MIGRYLCRHWFLTTFYLVSDSESVLGESGDCSLGSSTPSDSETDELGFLLRAGGLLGLARMPDLEGFIGPESVSDLKGSNLLHRSLEGKEGEKSVIHGQMLNKMCGIESNGV